MDGALPSALKHIISNPDFYGASLFHNGMIPLKMTNNLIGF
jgi:hypothetical protein